MLVPPQLLLLVKEPNVAKYDQSHVRTVLSGAAPLTVEVYRLLTKLLPQAHICQAYGSTETSGIISISPLYPKHMRPNSSGALVPGVRARIVKPDGTLAGYDEEGELHVKTPALATGYLNDEAATRATFLGDSWMRTGDLVKMDRSNEIVVVDRIKVRGFQVAPVELEGCILDHPMVTDVCVVGVPHLYNGEVPFAFVTISHEGQQMNKAELKASIQRHIEKNKAPFKRLHYVEIIDSIPKTPSGKLLRRVLRQEARKLVVPSAKL
ncbi:4-coumarate--CoA ligase 2 [Psilocybe cubensis]|uniref:4-coumarate--CoA ligase 2 n=1 Tax=Psilocybe cubensis TaxID=181762 RepID=A0ACB8GSC1_PSICU|nr:4-coumarate--CoA ligase 2 [Psilocybe cubensis]KAH9478638.1 4-coumarate--CoA ligase 2 [Psilocybe cubensis]